MPNEPQAAAHFEQGIALCNQGRFPEALHHFFLSVQLNPEDRVAWNNLGLVLANQDRVHDAIPCLRNACKPPAPVEHLINLAATLQHVGKFKEAGENFARVVEAQPGNAFAWKQLGFIRQEQGRVEEAVECFRKACAGPTDPTYQSNLVYASLFHPTMTPEQVFAEHLEWDRRHGLPRKRNRPHPNDRTPTRRLRVGYLSPNFHDHAVMVFLEPILAHHDHTQFEIVCYSLSDVVDETTHRLRSHADGWKSLLNLTEVQAAQAIENDRVDILVDMAEHMSGLCEAIIARKPAPVQLTWAYPYSSGLSAMDYRVTDEHADPSGQTERFHSEIVVRLPGSYYCYLPPNDSPDVAPAPCLANGYVTFGSMNQLPKLSPRVARLWSEILKQIPTSRLLLFAPGGLEENQHVLAWFTTCGIYPARLELLPRAPRKQFLEYFHRIDLALDPFPCVGHTTTCECLWMGPPVVTLAGTSSVQRMGASVLANVGLQHWITSKESDYVRLAVQLANDTDQLARVRSELRQQVLRSRLLNHAAVTKDMEAAYRAAWVRWCETTANDR